MIVAIDFLAINYWNHSFKYCRDSWQLLSIRV